MDLKFWNYVIPDGSTTGRMDLRMRHMFWNYVIPDGSTTLLAEQQEDLKFWNYVIPDGSTTMTRQLQRLRSWEIRAARRRRLRA